MNQTCKYCKQKFDFEKNQQFITHVASCKLNTNKEDKIKKMVETVLSKRKNYEFECKKCDKKYVLNLTPKSFENGNYTKFCSRSCANTRIISEDIKEKIKNGVNEYNIKNNKNRLEEEKTCLRCGEIFKTNRNYKFCSKYCSNHSGIGKSNIPNKNKISETRKRLFKEGKLEITGGTNKWFDVNTIKGTIRVQGSYEVITCKILDCLVIKGYIKDWNYTKDRFEYINIENKKSNYLLDFKVIENDNNFYYLETKGYKKENDDLKWESVRKKGFKLVIWFKEDIEKWSNILGIKIKLLRDGRFKLSDF